ncbi:MAG TPA: DUF393 domain-containing protein [Gammaproteobacteria bacterium]
MNLTIFYDSGCPLCLAEMRQLNNLNKAGRLNFVNLHDDDFSQHYPHINKARANRILHGQLDSGEILLGLDVTCLAWSLVGKHKWLVILRWPVLRWFADAVYLIFARYRNSISYLFTGKPRCNRCSIDGQIKN